MSQYNSLEGKLLIFLLLVKGGEGGRSSIDFFVAKMSPHWPIEHIGEKKVGKSGLFFLLLTYTLGWGGFSSISWVTILTKLKNRVEHMERTPQCIQSALPTVPTNKNGKRTNLFPAFQYNTLKRGSSHPSFD